MSGMKGNELRQMNFLDRIFVNKKAFLISNFVAIIGFLCVVCNELRHNDIPSIFRLASSGGLIASLICMRYCSQAYKDNAVKNIIGITLGVIFAYDLRFFDRDYSSFSTIEIIIGATKIALGLALIVLYILVRDSKRSNYKLIIYVRTAFFILTVFAILSNIPYFINDKNDILQFILQDIAGTLAFICTYFSIVCAACTVDRYKMIREYYINLGKWTEELREQTKKELFGK